MTLNKLVDQDKTKSFKNKWGEKYIETKKKKKTSNVGLENKNSHENILLSCWN